MEEQNKSTKPPVVARVIQVFAVMAVLGYAGDIASVNSTVGLDDLPIAVGTFTFSVFVILYSIWIVSGIESAKFYRRLPISTYLWFMLFALTFTNILRSIGLYLPRVELVDEQLLVAAITEVLRYFFYIVVIIWSGFSKPLKSHFQSTDIALNKQRNAGSVAER